MKDSRWFIPALALVAATGLLASTYSPTSADRQSTLMTTPVSAGDSAYCAHKVKAEKPRAARSGCCPLEDREKWNAFAKLVAARAATKGGDCCAIGTGTAAKSSTLDVLSACYSAIQKSVLAVVVHGADPQEDGCDGSCPTAGRTSVTHASRTPTQICTGCADAGSCGGACDACDDCPVKKQSKPSASRPKPQPVENPENSLRGGELGSE